MGRPVKVPRGVAAGRAVTTADVPAGEAQPKMDPWRVQSQALLTTERAGTNGLEFINMFA